MGFHCDVGERTMVHFAQPRQFCNAVERAKTSSYFERADIFLVSVKDCFGFWMTRFRTRTRLTVGPRFRVGVGVRVRTRA